MTKIIVSEDCGNSPKNIFIEKLTAVFVNHGAQFILGNVTDDIRWNIVGGPLVEGKDNFAKALQQMKNKKVAELSIRHIATHGKTGAVDGTVILESGETRAFCDVEEITSYVIDIR